MKKLLSLFLAMLFVLFSFAGCNPAPAETDEEDNEDEIEEIAGNFVDGSLIGFSISDPATLIKMFTGDDSEIDIKDIYVQAGADAEGKYSVFTLGAKLFGETYKADMFLGENIVIDAPKILDKAYGIGAAELVALLENLYKTSIPVQSTSSATVARPMSTGAIVMNNGGSFSTDYDTPAAAPDSAVGSPAWITMLLSPDNINLVVSLIENHYGTFVDSLAASGGLTKSETDTTVNYKGSLDENNISVIIADAFERLLADDDFFALLSQLGAPSKDELLKDKPSRNDMIAAIKNKLEPFNINVGFDMTFDKETLLPLASGTNFSMNPGSPMTGTIRFDLESAMIDISVKLDDKNYVDIELENGNMKYDVSFFMASVEDTPDITYQFSTGMKMYYELSDKGVLMHYSMTSDHDQKAPSFSYSYNSEKSMDFSLTKTDTGLSLYANMTAKAEDSDGNNQKVETIYKGSLDILDNGLKITFEADGVKMEAALTIGESDITGYVTVNDQKMGELIFAKTVEGTKTTVSLTGFEMQGVKMDFSNIGIKLYFDTNGKVAELPEYTSIAEFTAEDYQKLAESIKTKNAALIESLSGLVLPGIGASKKDEPTPEMMPTKPAQPNDQAVERSRNGQLFE